MTCHEIISSSVWNNLVLFPKLRAKMVQQFLTDVKQAVRLQEHISYVSIYVINRIMFILLEKKCNGVFGSMHRDVLWLGRLHEAQWEHLCILKIKIENHFVTLCSLFHQGVGTVVKWRAAPERQAVNVFQESTVVLNKSDYT